MYLCGVSPCLWIPTNLRLSLPPRQPPRPQLLSLQLGEAARGGGLHEQRGPRARRCPRVAGVVEAVVDPRQRVHARVGIDRGELPMAVQRLARARAALEAQMGQPAGQPQQVREILVGLLLPAAAPTSSKRDTSASRCRAAAAERKWGMPSIECQDPSGGSWTGKPNSESTPSMSTMQQRACAAGPPSGPLGCHRFARANLPGSTRRSKASTSGCRWSCTLSPTASPKPI